MKSVQYSRGTKHVFEDGFVFFLSLFLYFLQFEHASRIKFVL